MDRANPMPQNNPMTPEKFCSYVWDGDNGYSDCDEFIRSCKKRDAQLIRSTLEAAADRFCKLCPGPGCPGECKVDNKSDCGYWQIIAQKGKI